MGAGGEATLSYLTLDTKIGDIMIDADTQAYFGRITSVETSTDGEEIDIKHLDGSNLKAGQKLHLHNVSLEERKKAFEAHKKMLDGNGIPSGLHMAPEEQELMSNIFGK
jgi:hypothetical protein